MEYLDAFTVGFRPDEAGVYELHLLQTFDSFDAERE